MCYSEENEVNVPKIESLRYKRIEEYKDYEFSNCIAWEMMIRSRECIEIFESRNPEDNSGEWERRLYKFLDQHMLIPHEVVARKTFYYYEIDSAYLHKRNFVFEQNYYSLNLSHIVNGLERLINFYIKREEIYFSGLVSDDKPKKYSKVKNATIDDIVANLDNYAIPNRVKIFGRTIPLSLSTHLRLDDLEEEFLKTIDIEANIQSKYLSVSPQFDRPLLELLESKIIHLPVNIDMPEKELVAYILKLKEEYKGENFFLTSIPQIFDKELREIKEPKSAKRVPKNKNRKKVLAEAFFIYDSHRVLKPIYDEKQECYRKKRDEEINRASDTGQDRDEIRNAYEIKINEFSSEGLYSHIAQEIERSVGHVKTFHKYMKENIDELKYKRFISRKIMKN